MPLNLLIVTLLFQNPPFLGSFQWLERLYLINSMDSIQDANSTCLDSDYMLNVKEIRFTE